MKRVVVAVAVSIALVVAVPVRMAASGVDQESTQPADQAPDVPTLRLGPDGKPRASFMKSHTNFVKLAKQGNVDLLFLGDSITAGWSRNREIWQSAFGAWRPANFGIPGDKTQHLLWRITNGELDGITPKVIVVMIGTNNAATDPVDGIARGVERIVQAIRVKVPQSKILLLGVFPRGEKPNPLRQKLSQVNDIIARLDDGRSVYYQDIGGRLLDADGTLSREVMPDFVHLSARGYGIWADAITPRLAELMR